MSVMSCSRVDCNNILCNTYVEAVGYICNECQEEFKNYIKQKNLNPTKEWKITLELKNFMETPKDSYSDGKDCSIDDFFSERTR